MLNHNEKQLLQITYNLNGKEDGRKENFEQFRLMYLPVRERERERESHTNKHTYCNTNMVKIAVGNTE